MLHRIDIKEIKGIRIGHAEDTCGGTGCTVCIAPGGAPCGIDVRGGGPASRETELLKPTAAAECVHAVILCGGSAFGLAAADGVMKYLKERDIGFETAYGVVPLVAASSVFDLPCGDSTAYPDSSMGYKAAVASEMNDPREGNFGAGTGATVGKMHGAEFAMKSGQGICALQHGDVQAGALVVVNALGDVYDGKNTVLAGMRRADGGGFADSSRCLAEEGLHVWDKNGAAANTTIGFVVTNGIFTKTEMNKIAALASNGLARSIRPVNTTADGDSLYALSTGGTKADLNQVGELAALAVEKAVRRAVLTAQAAHGFAALRDL